MASPPTNPLPERVLAFEYPDGMDPAWSPRRPEFAYAANAVYRFRMTVDVAAHTYSVFVTPPGGSEMTLAMNYAFRSQQATVAGLNSWGVVMQSMATGNLKACGFSLE